jgi:hypothetical protein
MLSRRCGQALGLVCALSALGFGGCRDAADVCSGATCAASGGDGDGEDAGGASARAGSAGADEGALGGEAGAGPVAGGDSAGAAPTSGCHTDADCADGHACNGDERCVAGQCQAGKPVRCGTDLSCVEHEGGTASCDYGTPGRWFTFLGSNTGLFPFELRASRLEGSVPRRSISLSEGIVDQNYQIIDIDSWSPNGRHMIVLNPKDLEHINTNRLFLIEFGDGLPSAPVLLKDIPVGANSLSVEWAADSSAVFVQNFSTPSETYLVHVAPDGGMRTELVFSEDEDTMDLHFCPNPRYFYRTKGGDSTLVDSQQPKQEKLLWHSWAESSPDNHWILTSDDTTGLWLAACEPGTVPRQFSDEPTSGSFYWSSAGRFMAVTHGDPADEIEVFDTANQFGSVFKRAEVDFRWAPNSPRLMLLGEPDAKGLLALTEIDLSTLPPTSISRGTTALPSDWGFVNDGTLWAVRDDAGGTSSFWLLESGSNVWRRVVSGLASATPSFTANDAFVIFGNSLTDGTSQYLAFSLHDKNPVAIPLLPTPLNGDVTLDYALNDGMIVSRFTGIEPFEGQIWWIASSASGFAKPTPLSDVRVSTEPGFQPQP